MFPKMYFHYGENCTYIPVQLDDGSVMTYWCYWPGATGGHDVQADMQFYFEDEL